MRLTSTMFLTLDGVYQGPGGPQEDTGGGFSQGGWVVPFFDEQLGAYMSEIFEDAGAFVLGRHTYEIFAGSWPQATDMSDPIAGGLNKLPKHVASTKLASAEWNNSSVISGSALDAVAKLKRQPGRELQIHGSGRLVQSLFDAGLIDVFRLITFPVVLGAGRRLFTDGRTPSRLRLADLQVTKSGVTMQTLEVDGAPEFGTASVG